MDDGPPDADDRDRRLNAAIAAFLEAREAGEESDPEAWLARHPDLAEGLTEFFQADGLLHWIVTSTVPAAPGRGARFGRYYVHRVLGRGGMGVVYEAEDPADGRRVALKVLPTCGLPDPLDFERFRRGADIVARLDHPNIVPLLEVEEHEGIPYLAMPLIDGPNLRRVIRELRRPSPPRNPDENPSASYRVALPESPDDPSPLAPDRPRWRAVAKIGLQAARALAHAHEHDVLHRDVKPSNLLLDAAGTVHLTDFGLARARGDADLTETGDLAGTIRYTAAERLLHGWRADPRSDLYSLGLTLYELLTLRAAFPAPDRSELLRSIAQDSPPRPRRLDRDVPRDLERIVLKAIEKEPGHRYQSARDLADDLQRFLDGRPVLARPVHPARKLWSWARRHKARSAAIAAAVMSLVLGIVGLIRYESLRADAAQAHAKVAQAERDAALSREKVVQAERDAAESARREDQYHAMLQTIRRARAFPRHDGWSDRARALVLEAAKIRKDSALRDQAAATLLGLDAHLKYRYDQSGASSLAFSPDGKILLMGGLDPGQGREPRAKLWTLSEPAPKIVGKPGAGPVTFRDQESPLQLVADSPGQLVLWDVARVQAAARFDFPGGGAPKVLTLSSDAGLAAAVIPSAEDTAVFVWDGRTGKLLRHIPGAASALAISPDGRLLATGEDAGRIVVRNLPEGEVVTEFRQKRGPIQAIRFAPDPLLDSGGRRNWLLAAGSLGGLVIVWDVEARTQRSVCSGMDYAVYDLVFSPDGSTLAGSSHRNVVLWDVATGRELLRLMDNTSIYSIAALAFSPDGRRLAAGNLIFPGYRDEVRTWDLENGRGLQTFRGLDASPPLCTCFSPDGRHLAAIARDFRVATWEIGGGRLLSIREAMPGMRGLNSALTFSPDGRRLVVVGGRLARLQDVVTGRDLWTRKLPPGVMDVPAFHASGKILLARAETLSGKYHPAENPNPEGDPQLFRIHDLMKEEDLAALPTIRKFNSDVIGAWAVHGDNQFLIAGAHQRAEGHHWLIGAFDSLTGAELWSYPIVSASPADGVGVFPDPTGMMLGLSNSRKDRTEFLDLASGSEIGNLDWLVHSLGPDGQIWARRDEKITPETMTG